MNLKSNLILEVKSGMFQVFENVKLIKNEEIFLIS